MFAKITILPVKSLENIESGYFHPASKCCFEDKPKIKQKAEFVILPTFSFLVILVSRWVATTITTGMLSRPFQRKKFASSSPVPKHKPSLRRPSIQLITVAVYRMLFWLVDLRMNVLVWDQTLPKLIASGELSFSQVRICTHLNRLMCLSPN